MDASSPPPRFTRRRILKLTGKSLLGGVGAALGAAGYAHYIEPFWPEVNSVEIPLPEKYASLHGLHIVQLTDFHYKPDSDDELMGQIVKMTNALNPDLILLTGDFINHDSKVIRPLTEHFAQLRAKLGIYACVGNHDIWNISRYKAREILGEKGIQLLLNQHTIIPTTAGEKLALCGLDSAWFGHPSIIQATQGLRSDLPLISMMHEPDEFDRLKAHGRTFLQLSGHTHGGQCRVPFIGYVPVKVKHGKKYIYGHFTQNDAHLFVSRGIGTTGMRVRFACRPEIASIKLVSRL